jgi:hypothetical protein
MTPSEAGRRRQHAMTLPLLEKLWGGMGGSAARRSALRKPMATRLPHARGQATANRVRSSLAPALRRACPLACGVHTSGYGR